MAVSPVIGACLVSELRKRLNGEEGEARRKVLFEKTLLGGMRQHRGRCWRRIFCDGFAAGRRTFLMMVTEGDADGGRLSPFRLCGEILPGWYGHFFRNEAEMLCRFLGSDFSEMRRVEPDARNMLSAMMLPGLAQIAAREWALSARYRALTVLIEAELSKRDTGFYPETMADLPVAPFSGEPMRYCNARIPVIRRVFREELRSWENRLVGVDVVMVWSIGPDGRDDR